MKRRVAVTVAVAMASFGILAAPASATVHEITGMVCSGGNAIFNPPGISGANGASHRGGANLAMPLFASGFATFDPTGGPGDAALISFDENHPASKIELTGGLLEIEPGLWLTAFTFSKGSWQNCL